MRTTQFILSFCMLFGLEAFGLNAADNTEDWKGSENNVSVNMLTPVDQFDLPTGHEIMKESPFEMFAQLIDDTASPNESISSMLKPSELPDGNGDTPLQALEENLVREVAFRNQATLRINEHNSHYKTFDSTASHPSIIPSQEKVRVRLTFYSGQDDQWGDRVAWDKVARAKKGRTIAADPAVFPYGTWLNIPGFGNMRVEDTGSAVKARVASGGKDPVVDVYVAEEKEVNRLSSLIPEYVEVKYLGGK